MKILMFSAYGKANKEKYEFLDICTAFGNKLFYKYWIKACEQVGIEGVDLYAGTRHTTTTEIARRYGSENAMKASDHQTNKAFKRYCQHQDDTAFEMAVAAKKSKQELNNVIKFTG